MCAMLTNYRSTRVERVSQDNDRINNPNTFERTDLASKRGSQPADRNLPFHDGAMVARDGDSVPHPPH